MPVPDSVTRAVESFMQAVQGCGPITEYTRNEAGMTTHVVHADQCPLDIPDEVMMAMTAEQQRVAFGQLERGESLPRPGTARPTVETLPTAEVDLEEFTSRQRSAGSYRNAVRNSDYAGSVSVLPTARVDTTSSQTARGRKFIGIAKSFGLKLSSAFELPVGVALNEMYGDMEARVNRSAAQVQRYVSEFERLTEDWKRQVEQSARAAGAAREDAGKLARLREAAVAWRDSTESPTEKFARFEKLMAAIDAVPAAAPEEVSGVDLPPNTLADTMADTTAS